MSEVVKVSFYNLETGEIDRWIECPEDHVSIQLQPGEGVLNGVYDNRKHYVHGGQVHEYTEEQAATKASCPWYATGWSNIAMSWGDSRELQDHKEAKWIQIKAARDAASDAGFTWDGSTFQSDAAKSRGEITGAALAASIAKSTGQPFSINWTLTDNSVRSLNADQMIATGMALLAHINAVHEIGRGLRAQIDAATTVEEVEAITWD